MKALKQQYTSKEKQYDFPSLNIFFQQLGKNLHTRGIGGGVIAILTCGSICRCVSTDYSCLKIACNWEYIEVVYFQVSSMDGKSSNASALGVKANCLISTKEMKRSLGMRKFKNF